MIPILIPLCLGFAPGGVDAIHAPAVLTAENDAADQIAALLKEFDEQSTAWMAEYRKEGADRETLLKNRPDGAKVFAKVQPLIEKAGGADAALDACLLGMRWSDQPASLVEHLEKHFVMHERAGEAVSALAYVPLELAESYFLAVLEDSEVAAAKGAACYALASGAKRKLEGGGLEAAVAKKLEAQAEEYYARLHVEFNDVPVQNGRTPASFLEGELFALRNLIPGKTAPEFTGKTIDGHEFKLSDYRGKVVLVDFYGFW